MTKKFICPICGYVHEGTEAPERCPQCKQIVEVTVIADCCAGLSKESHEAALKVMECCQCNIR